VTWTKTLRKQHLKRRHYEDHKWRSTSIKQSPRHEEKCSHSRIVYPCATNCLVAHRTVWCHPTDCPVHQGTWAQWLVPSDTAPDCSVHHQTIQCKTDSRQRSLATVISNGYGAPDTTPDCSVPTTGLSGVPQSNSFSPTTIIEVGPIYTSPNRAFEGVGAQTTYQHIL
jgi:hypothetical protein